MHRGNRAAFAGAPRCAALTALLLSAFAGAAAWPVALRAASPPIDGAPAPHADATPPGASARAPRIEAPAGSQPDQEPAPVGTLPRAPRGRVRLEGRAFADDDGPRPALGASLLWLAWGYRHDRARLEANLRWLAERGVDFVRALGEVGGEGWEDRAIDPAWPDYAAVIGGATALANRCGLRVEWTLFGGGAVRTRDAWRAAARKAVDALRPVVAGVQFVEIQNEEQGPPPDLARELAAEARHALGVEVAISGTPPAMLAALYEGSAATVATVHFDRRAGDDGWQSARQAWDWRNRAGAPPAFVNNEPAGIASSVRAENDPVRLASDALVTWIAGGAAYVLHHGAGIHGREYTHPTAGRRRANAWEQPALADALGIIARIRSVLPGDIAAWEKAENRGQPPDPVPPFRFPADLLGARPGGPRGLAGAFTAMRGPEFFTVVLGARGDAAAEEVRPVTATVRELREWVERPWPGRLAGADSTYLVHGR
ncbi:MAG TPA: hypothetical protein PLN93_06395 [Vicinamibacterales bacterium]|nr:hypothetical protein [Vicinamibacterales bacterium]HOQ59609.1 hypothetical protein [Vicinamibacterales bacterium]HPK71551.1 hypothetical protein [Vicinamibacterales bacterium]